MILNGKRWHYLAVKSLNNYEKQLENTPLTFILRNAFILLQPKTDMNLIMWKVNETKDFCNVGTPFGGTKKLEFNRYQKFDNATFIIYANRYCLRENITEYQKNRERLSPIKVCEHIPSGFSIYTISSF